MDNLKVAHLLPPSDAPASDSTKEAEAFGRCLSRREANHIVKESVIAAMGSAWVPIPVADFLLVAGVCVLMLRRLCEFYEEPFDRQVARRSVLVLAASTGPMMAGAAANSLAKVIPGAAILVGGPAASMSAGAFVYAVGQVFIRHFEQGGSLASFPAEEKAGELRAEKLRVRPRTLGPAS